MQLIACILKATTGGLPGDGESWFLPLPLLALFAGTRGKRAADLLLSLLVDPTWFDFEDLLEGH